MRFRFAALYYFTFSVPFRVENFNDEFIIFLQILLFPVKFAFFQSRTDSSTQFNRYIFCLVVFIKTHLVLYMFRLLDLPEISVRFRYHQYSVVRFQYHRYSMRLFNSLSLFGSFYIYPPELLYQRSIVIVERLSGRIIETRMIDDKCTIPKMAPTSSGES